MSVEARDAQALQDFRRGLDQLSDREDGVANNSVTQVLLRGMSDGDCLRFVRARKYDVQKALLMADKWSKWYVTCFEGKLHPSGTPVSPSNIVDEPYHMEHVRNQLCPHSYCGMDKEGRPVYWEETGLISTRFAELSTYFSVDDLVVQHVRMQELMRVRCEYSSKIHGRVVDKVVCVMNLKNLSYRLDTEALRAFRLNLQIDTDYYPERLKYLYMINAPWFFTSLWAMMKPLIDPVTADKIKIVGKDYLNVLREHIDDDQIPQELGGSCQEFKWEYPFPESTGISESQLGYMSSAIDDSCKSPVHSFDEMRSRTSSMESKTPQYVCLAAVVNARITEVERLKSHDEYIISVKPVEDESQSPMQAKHRYSDFVKLRNRLKRILKSEKEALKTQHSRQPSVNQGLKLPQLPPKKLFSQSGAVLSSRILGLSSFLTTLLLSVKISNQSMYYPGSELNARGGNTGIPSTIEDPVVQLVMQFLMYMSPSRDSLMVSRLPSEQVIEDLHWGAKKGNDTRVVGAVEDVEDIDNSNFNDEEEEEELLKDGEEGIDLQSQLKQLAGGGIVSVAIFGLSVIGSYLQQIM